jgi:hypothetical protein
VVDSELNQMHVNERVGQRMDEPEMKQDRMEMNVQETLNQEVRRLVRAAKKADLDAGGN